jgi:hypothetical protein
MAGPQFLTCTFANNIENSHAAIYIVLEVSVTFINCLMQGNHGYTGAVIWANGDCDLTMINCTVTNYFNDAESHGAVKFIGDDCLITNCVLYGNANQLGESEEAQLILGGSGTQVVKNCDIQGLDAFAGNGNVDVDPDFVNAGGDDYRLAYTSLLLNNGDTSDLVADSFDIDDDSNTTEKVPARDMGLRQVNPATCVDMGAYENTVDNNNCPSDISGAAACPTQA